MKRIIQLSSLFCLAIIVLIACTSKTPQPQKTMATPIKESESEQTPESAPLKNYVDSTVYDVVEQMPSFPGGEEKMHEFISTNLKYPDIANESCVQGTTIIRFIVTKTGKLKNFLVLRSLDPAFDNEALRVLKIMPAGFRASRTVQM